MNLLQRLRFLFDRQYSMWHIARVAQHVQVKPTTQPITALDVEQNIHLLPTQQIRALPKTQRAAVQCAMDVAPSSTEYQTEPIDMLSATEHLKSVSKERKNDAMLY